jgi:hypothetical protein
MGKATPGDIQSSRINNLGRLISRKLLKNKELDMRYGTNR